MNSIFEDTIAIAAPIMTIVLGIIVLASDLGKSSPQKRRLLPLLSLIGLVLTAIVGYATSYQVPVVTADRMPTTVFGGSMVLDSFGGLFTVALCIVAGLSIAMSDRYLEEKHLDQGEFYALILFATAGAMVMAQAFDLVNVFVGLEVLSVALYILCGFARRERRSEEAAVKYFLLGSFASAFFVFGTALVYGAVGIALQGQGVSPVNNSYTNFNTIASALQVTGMSDAPLAASPLFVLGVALVIVGLGFKASIVPFHSYAPDVYEGAPTSVTAFMSAGAKIGAFAAFVRLFHALLITEAAEPFRLVLWFLAAATMLVGNILAVRQTSIKRMLAYSSIAHAGYILVGVLASGAGAASESARQAILYYLFIYTFMNLGAFALIIWLGRGGREYTDIRDYAGLAKRQPLAALVMAIFMLSLAGIPPAAGFFGKLYLFMTAIQAGQTGLAILGLVVSAIGVFYYLNIIVQMYFREPEHDFETPRAGGAKWAALISAGAIILFGLVPTLITSLTPRGDVAEEGNFTDSAKYMRPRPVTPTAMPTTAAVPTPAGETPVDSGPETDATPSPSAQPVNPVPRAAPISTPAATPAEASRP